MCLLGCSRLLGLNERESPSLAVMTSFCPMQFSAVSCTIYSLVSGLEHVTEHWNIFRGDINDDWVISENINGANA